MPPQFHLPMRAALGLALAAAPWLLAPGLLAPAAARAPVARAPAAAPLQASVDDRAGFGRLILPAPGKGRYRITRHGETLVIAHARNRGIADPAQLPRNVTAITSGPLTTEITVGAGVQIRTRLVHGSLVVDALDPPGQQPPLPAAAAAATVAEPPPPGPAQVTPVQAETLAAPQSPLAPAGAIAPPAASPPDPVPAAAISPPTAPPRPAPLPIEPVAGAAEPTILLRTSRDAGLAAFRAAGDVVVVLDTPIDFAPPGPDLAPPFAQLTSRRNQEATVIRIPMAAPGTIRLSRDTRGWLVAAAPSDSEVAAAAGIVPALVESSPGIIAIRLPASAPGHVVTVLDPVTGGRLLVGTQGKPGEAVVDGHLQVQLSLPPTLQGVVVAATSDDIQLRGQPGGFMVTAGSAAGNSIVVGGDILPTGQPAPLPLSLLFNIPHGTTQSLVSRLNEQTGFAATAPALARSVPRMAVAETMLALGLGPEAQAVLDVATGDDPTLRDLPRTIGLRAAAALLAHRPDGADAIGNPALTGTGEVELWRAMVQVERGQVSGQTARNLAATLPILLAYPASLRDRLLPGVLETMALNGQAAAAATALAGLPGDPGLDLVRGMVHEMANEPAAALALYDRVATSRDRLAGYKAQLRAIELRLKDGKLDATAAADAMDRTLYGWRGPAQEFALRLRIAALRRQAGQWREALDVLRDGRVALPDDRPAIDQQMEAIFADLLTGEPSPPMATTEFVALFDQNQDLIQKMSWTEPDATKVVDHLAALGLQTRAEPIMARLVALSTDPARRVVLGARLAALRMTMGDPNGAIAALSDTAPPAGTGDPAVMAARQLMYARAEAGRGNTDAALAMLQTLDTPEALAARADIYTARKDWPNAVAVLTALEGKRIGPATDLTADQQSLVMRLAVAASLAADTDTVQRLARTYAPAMAKGDSAAMFRLVSSPPIRGTADLPRAFEEIQLARQLPTKLGAGVKP